MQKAGRAVPPEPSRSTRAESAADKIQALEKQLAAAKLASTRAPTAQRGRSGSRGRSGRGRSGSRRQAEASAAPDCGFAVVNRRRWKSKGQRLESAHTAAAPAAKKVTRVETEPSEIVVEGEMATTQWQCADCGTLHDKFAKQCRLCSWKRTPAPMAAAAEAAGSAVGKADDLAKMQQECEILKKLEHIPGVEGSIAGLQSKIEALLKPAVPAPVPDQATQLREAQLAVDAALARIKSVTERVDSAVLKIARWQTDREALERSLTNAQQRHQEALSAIATVRLAVGAQTTGAPRPMRRL